MKNRIRESFFACSQPLCGTEGCLIHLKSFVGCLKSRYLAVKIVFGKMECIFKIIITKNGHLFFPFAFTNARLFFFLRLYVLRVCRFLILFPSTLIRIFSGFPFFLAEKSLKLLTFWDGNRSAVLLERIGLTKAKVMI